jgi:hypothetical protein
MFLAKLMTAACNHTPFKAQARGKREKSQSRKEQRRVA